MIFHPIHHTFAPHVDAAYAWETLKLLFQPWQWQKGKETEELRVALGKHFQAEVTLFASGREALLALLQSLHIGKDDEVIIQSYTCVVVPNAIAATGAAPIYADIDPETLNLTPETVEAVISNRTKAMICQHTFGIPADTERIRELCDQYEIPLIEDCAHIIPDFPLSPRERVRVRGTDTIGTYGDYIFLSFGRDKAISGIAGGALIMKSPRNIQPSTSAEPVCTSLPAGRQAPDRCSFGICDRASERCLAKAYVFRLLLYPLLYWMARHLYGLGIGKSLLWLAAKLGLLVPIVTKEEKEGRMSTTLHAIPNACAALALTQFRKLQQINDHRRTLTKFYLQVFKNQGWPAGRSLGEGWKVLEGITEDLPLQKFPMSIDSPLLPQRPARMNIRSDGERGRGRGENPAITAHDLRSLLKRKNIHLDDGWTSCIICPSFMNPHDASYSNGQNPEAEEVKRSILSLPTHPTMTLEQAQRLCKELERVLPTQHATAGNTMGTDGHEYSCHRRAPGSHPHQSNIHVKRITRTVLTRHPHSRTRPTP